MVFCTLFDSNYLDKGLVLYRSLLEQTKNFRMYVLAMDERCQTVLESLQDPLLVVIPLDEFVQKNNLVEIQRTRRRSEFCWTCTSFLIDYVLTCFDEPICTYIDADLCFYSDPQVLLDEMGEKTVQIVEHRFNPSFHGRLCRKESGTYCVQFNTFKNTPDAMELLRWWKTSCMGSVSNLDLKKGVFGDQGYLETWGEKNNVSVLKHLGGGVAPWNLAQYELDNSGNGNTIILLERKSGKTFPLVFYHYHNILYYERNKVDISVYEEWKADRRLVERLYIPYLKKLDTEKTRLQEQFGFFPLLKEHPGKVEPAQEKKSPLRRLISSLANGTLVPGLFYISFDKKRKKYSHLNVIEF